MNPSENPRGLEQTPQAKTEDSACGERSQKSIQAFIENSIETSNKELKDVSQPVTTYFTIKPDICQAKTDGSKNFPLSAAGQRQSLQV